VDCESEDITLIKEQPFWKMEEEEKNQKKPSIESTIIRWLLLD